MKGLCAATVIATLCAALPAAAQNQPGSQSRDLGQAVEQQVDQVTITRLQERLKDQGYYEGEITGLLDPPTQQALGQFQQDQNVGERGRIDRDTLTALGIRPGGNEQAETPDGQQQQPED